MYFNLWLWIYDKREVEWKLCAMVPAGFLMNIFIKKIKWLNMQTTMNNYEYQVAKVWYAVKSYSITLK